MDSEDQIEPSPDDKRLYLPQHEGWEGRVKSNSTKEYCYYKSPGEDYFHLIVIGEIYLIRGDEKCCLNCAIRHGVVTLDRLHWQNRVRRKKPSVFNPGSSSSKG
ncbi:MAG: hypothetical protein JKY95_19700 [Planctomycetaceae bacterium]|nr:hypothetical protein [Planctomycetaceae bacterium]